MMSNLKIRASRWIRSNLVRGMVLWVIATSWVMARSRDQGIARDEVVYMNAAQTYVGWWSKFFKGQDALNHKSITGHFGGKNATDNNREHPPLIKTLMGISYVWFAKEKPDRSPVQAFRLPTAICHGATIALVYFLGCLLFSSWVGLAAALFMLFLPRALFHAGLATFDAPVVTFWLGTLYAYARSFSSKRWAIGLAVLWGCALATKHNAWMLPGVLGPHYLWTAWQARQRKEPFWQAPWSLVALVLGGPLVFVALWPWMWFDTFAHLKEWLQFHLKHVHYNYEYLGNNWNTPPFPWHVSLVTTALTTPVVTLVCALGGATLWISRSKYFLARSMERVPAAGLLLLLSLGVSVGIFFMGSTPIFGAEKHWAAAMPIVCLAAGVGLVGLFRHLLQSSLASNFPRAAKGLIGAATLAVLAALAVETHAAHPYGLSYYNALAGGVPGGATLGMNRQFWGVSARGIVPWVNAYTADKTPPPRSIYTHDASPAWSWYKKDGWLRSPIADAGGEGPGIAKSDIAIVIHEKHFLRHDLMIWKEYGTISPAWVLTFHGVPLVSVYVRPRPER